VFFIFLAFMKPTFLQTPRRESWTTYFFRKIMNWMPTYFGTGGTVIFVASDWQEIHLRLRLNWRTVNYVRTIFGGSFFAAADPFYMLMLLKNLGKDYVVWDKSAAIRFKRPGKTTLYAKFAIDENLLQSLREKVAQEAEIEHTFLVQWVDKNGIVYAEIDRLCYIAQKSFYEAKMAQRQKEKQQVSLSLDNS
jgi:acyl-coenzyme A thioesterase PaaI-like protein